MEAAVFIFFLAFAAAQIALKNISIVALFAAFPPHKTSFLFVHLSSPSQLKNIHQKYNRKDRTKKES